MPSLNIAHLTSIYHSDVGREDTQLRSPGRMPNDWLRDSHRSPQSGEVRLAPPHDDDVNVYCYLIAAARGLASPSPSPSPSPTISQPPTSNTPSSSPSDTPTSSSSQPSATPDPVFTQGHLACTNLDTGVFAGYVSRNLNSFGEYVLTESSANRIQVEIDLDAAQAGPVDITLINGSTLPTYPFLGAISGFANADYNLGPGSYHYAYLGGVTQSAPGAPAVEQDNSFTAATGSTVGTESAIWRYNPVTQEVTPTWVNVDGSLPSVSLFYDSASEAFIITADRAEFENVFGNAGTYECALSFEAATVL
ncbi:hypothetical protein ONZ45_g10372 [Pleurotus djamor]|nr:hypothetical protein ONZ45_g10372 [Pleurotus djamor]